MVSVWLFIGCHEHALTGTDECSVWSEYVVPDTWFKYYSVYSVYE